jgi:hypothetical protein
VAVAVSNALDSLKDRCNWVTNGDHGQGVVELIERLIADDLSIIQRLRAAACATTKT